MQPPLCNSGCANADNESSCCRHCAPLPVKNNFPFWASPLYFHPKSLRFPDTSVPAPPQYIALRSVRWRRKAFSFFFTVQSPPFPDALFSFARIRNSCDFTLPSLIFKLPASSLTGSAQKYRRTNIFRLSAYQCFQKTIDRCGGFPALDLVLYTFAGWNTFFQFVQKRLRLAASALLGMPCPIFTDRKVSHYFPQKSRQKFRFPGESRSRYAARYR